MSFAKNISTNLRNKYIQNLLDSAKKSTKDALKTASKIAIQKTAEATSDLTGNNPQESCTQEMTMLTVK